MEPLDARKSNSRGGGPSFSLGNRLGRVVWMACWFALARWTPPALHGWRALLLRLFGADLGSGCRVHGSASIWHPANLALGDNVLIGPGARIYNQGQITIGKDSIVSQRAHLCASTHDISDQHFQLILRPITIGKGCWIAAEAFVGPGVVMGDHAILAARGALFDDAEPNQVYRGNPAQMIKARALPADAG